MKAGYLAVACLLGASAPATAQVTNGTQAAAVFERIRSTPAELARYCEQDKLKRDSTQASRKGDAAKVSAIGRQIAEIQTSLPGYRDSAAFFNSKSSTPVYFKTNEGKALETAQKNLAVACPLK